MAVTFAIARAKELVWPEAMGLGMVATTHIVVRGIDAAAGLTKPFRRVSDWAHVVLLLGSAYAYGKNMAPDITRAIFLGDAMLLVSSLGDLFFERVVGPRIQRVATRRRIPVGAGGNPFPGRPEPELLGGGQRVPLPEEEKPVRMTH